MTTTIQKWGNSYAVRLPREALRLLNLRAGHPVEIRKTAHSQTLCIVPIQKRDASLAEMVARITKKNLHGATDWGSTVGKEVW
jgi:antitoxin MazE